MKISNRWLKLGLVYPLLIINGCNHSNRDLQSKLSNNATLEARIRSDVTEYLNENISKEARLKIESNFDVFVRKVDHHSDVIDSSNVEYQKGIRIFLEYNPGLFNLNYYIIDNLNPKERRVNLLLKLTYSSVDSLAEPMNSQLFIP